MYCESTFNRYKHNIRKTWQTLNEIISKSQKKEQLPTMFTHGQQQLTDHREIANQFNIFFANIVPIQSNSINDTGDKPFDAYLKEPNKISFQHKYVNESTIMTIITNLPNKNSCGFDGLSTTILNSIKGIIIKPLTLIINQLLDTGVFPANLKIAKIIPRMTEQYSITIYPFRYYRLFLK